MTKFLIVSADGTSGRGSRGLNLYWFLAAYHGRGAVKLVPTAALKGSTHSCDVLFLGLPTEIAKDDLTGVRYRQMALFDYQDTATVLVDEKRAFLEALTDHYLKVWVEPEWKGRWKFGVLPIRRQMRLPVYLRYLAFTKSLGARAPVRDYDISFLGAPTGYDVQSQRVQWLREIRGAGDRYRFWGGLAATEGDRQRWATAGFDSTGLLYDGGRVGFTTFFDMMRRSKAVLTPMGNARWSYRHYEAIYAGAIPVSCDMRRAKVLIPLPLDGMVHVPDGTPVLPRIDEAIALTAKRPDVRDANIEFLERYLEHGDYTRRRPALIEAFAAQLDG